MPTKVTPVARILTLVPLAALAACGGKILEERGGGATVDEPPSTTTLEAAPAPPPPRGATSTSADPCTAICEGNGLCVGGQTECSRRCAEDLANASCAAEANTYIRCYADRLEGEGCSVLPPVCEGAYCAYTRCAGKVVPAYCH